MAAETLSELATPRVLPYLASMIRMHGMYPAGHPTLARSMDMLKGLFDDYFINRRSLMVGIGRDSLYFGDSELKDEDWIQALALTLHQHSISHVTFHRGLEISELVSFMDSLRLEPLEVRAAGGYRKLLASRGVSSIEVTEVEYSLYDGEIEEQLAAMSDAQVWRRIAQGWRRGLIQLGAEDLAFVRRLLSDAPRLAMIVDSALAGRTREEDAAEAANVFSRVIESLIDDARGQTEDDKMALEGQILRVMSCLSPQGRYALIESSVLAPTQKGPSHVTTSVLLHQLHDRALARSLIEGLDPARSRLEDFCRIYESYVTPQREHRVLSEIERLAVDHDVKHDSQFAIIVARAAELPTSRPALERLRSTITRSHERQTSREIPIYEYIETMSMGSAEILAGLTETAIEETACRNLLKVLSLTREAEHYEFYAQGVDDMVVGLINTGRYQLAEKAMRLLRGHASKRNENEHSQMIARQAIKSVRRPELVDELVGALREWGKEQSDVIGELLIGMGPIAIEPVMRALESEQNRAVRVAMINILARAGDKVVPLIKERMKSADWFVVRNMINLLARLGTGEMAEILDAAASHEEPRVRKEVGRALMGTDDPRGVTLLTRMIEDADQGVRHQAILSLSHYKGSEEACAALCRKLLAKAPFDGDARAEELAIETLGKIRNPKCVEALAGYIEGSGLLGGPSEDLRVAAAKALGCIEDPECRRLIEKGARSRKKALRQACETLLRQSAGSRGS